MKNFKLFSLLLLSSFLMFQSCKKLKELLEITVDLPLSDCYTVVAPQSKDEVYTVKRTIDNSKTQDILDENNVDASAIRSIAPNQIIVRIDNPDDTSFEITDFKSIKVVISEITVAERTIDDAVVSGNMATFTADDGVDLTEYLKETSVEMEIIAEISKDVTEDTKLCFELINDMKIGLPE